METINDRRGNRIVDEEAEEAIEETGNSKRQKQQTKYETVDEKIDTVCPLKYPADQIAAH